MARLRRPQLFAEAARRNAHLMAALGGELRRSRLARRLTQAQLAAAIGVVQSTISRMERGRGGSLSVDVWQRAFAALDRDLTLVVTRDALEEPADAGHLALQELVVRVGRVAGYRGLFELRTRASDPRRSVDVGLRDDRRKRLILAEVWNAFGDVGAAARSTNRKVAEAEELAAAIWGEAPHTIAACWVVRATKRNRALVARYPELFAARFPGSSVGGSVHSRRVRTRRGSRGSSGRTLPRRASSRGVADSAAMNAVLARQRWGPDTARLLTLTAHR